MLMDSRLSVSDLVIVLDAGKNSKGVGKLVGKLKEGGLVSVYARQEQREGASKSINREYYYIDYRRAIDAVKYKIHMIHQRVNKDAKPTTEKAEFFCPQCKAQWTTMEVIDLIDFEGRESGFLCRTCSHPLKSINATGEAEVENDDTPAKFNRLFKPLLDLMQQIDEVTIPAIEGKDALEGALELPRDKDVNPGAKHEVVPTMIVKPTAVKGVNTAPEKITVNIASNSEYNEAARAAEQARQAKLAAQNQLPEWHTTSTITNQRYDGNNAGSKLATNGVGTPTIKTEGGADKNGKDPSLDAVFAALEEERRKKEQEEDDDEEDEEEDEFEDVAVGTPSALPDAKRVKLESSAAPTPSNGATPAASNGDATAV